MDGHEGNEDPEMDGSSEGSEDQETDESSEGEGEHQGNEAPVYPEGTISLAEAQEEGLRLMYEFKARAIDKLPEIVEEFQKQNGGELVVQITEHLKIFPQSLRQEKKIHQSLQTLQIKFSRPLAASERFMVQGLRAKTQPTAVRAALRKLGFMLRKVTQAKGQGRKLPYFRFTAYGSQEAALGRVKKLYGRGIFGGRVDIIRTSNRAGIDVF